MFEVSRSGDWAGWINFFMDIVAQTCRDTIVTADKLLSMRERYRKELQGAGRSALLLSIVDRLFTHPVFSIPQLADHLNVTAADQSHTPAIACAKEGIGHLDPSRTGLHVDRQALPGVGACNDGYAVS